jgi:antitoxin (DNA-binding transcriptional repressor) of toxin-antitoxin stability system
MRGDEGSAVRQTIMRSTPAQRDGGARAYGSSFEMRTQGADIVMRVKAGGEVIAPPGCWSTRWLLARHSVVVAVESRPIARLAAVERSRAGSAGLVAISVVHLATANAGAIVGGRRWRR